MDYEMESPRAFAAPPPPPPPLCPYLQVSLDHQTTAAAAAAAAGLPPPLSFPLNYPPAYVPFPPEQFFPLDQPPYNLYHDMWSSNPAAGSGPRRPFSVFPTGFGRRLRPSRQGGSQASSPQFAAPLSAAASTPGSGSMDVDAVSADRLAGHHTPSIAIPNAPGPNGYTYQAASSQRLGQQRPAGPAYIPGPEYADYASPSLPAMPSGRARSGAFAYAADQPSGRRAESHRGPPGQGSVPGLEHGYSGYAAPRAEPLVHQSWTPSLPAHQDQARVMSARERPRHRHSYPVNSYAGMMTSLSPGQDLDSSVSHLSEAMRLDGPNENDEPPPLSRHPGRERLTEYLASGQFERNVAQGYENDMLTRPGQPLRDLASYMAESEARRPPNVNRYGDGPDDAAAPRIRQHAGVPRRERASQLTREANAELDRVVGDAGRTIGLPAHARLDLASLDYGAGTRRASRRVMEGLKEVDIKSLAKDDRCCNICMEELGVPEPIEGKVEFPVKLPCGHVFGKTCIKTWFGDHCTCPACRRKVESELHIPASSARRAGQRAGFDTFRNRAVQAMSGATGSAVGDLEPLNSYYVHGLTEDLFGAPPTLARRRDRAPPTGRSEVAYANAMFGGAPDMPDLTPANEYPYAFAPGARQASGQAVADPRGRALGVTSDPSTSIPLPRHVREAHATQMPGPAQAATAARSSARSSQSGRAGSGRSSEAAAQSGRAQPRRSRRALAANRTNLAETGE
ncbi:MAG: hypothetical protein M1832_001870 [Thelocarpon impressellum]|nr:MAG: hypothetical protein M1832_001870 [Thelocarpon impressellum]